MATENKASLVKSSVARIKKALAITAALRGAKPDQITLTAYSQRLGKEPEQDVMFALEKLAEMQRKEYESAIPDIGTLLALVQVCTLARHNREDAEKNRCLITWECPECGATMSGFLTPEQPTKRRCQSPYKPKAERKPFADSLPAGQICGALMIATVHEKEPERVTA